MLARIDLPDTDAGPRRAGPLRTCVVTRRVHPVADMIRFVLAPDGSVVPDVKRRLPGRGVWVAARRQAVTEAVTRNVFQRRFRAAAKVPADLAASVEALLERALLDALGISRKAGQVVGGFAKVEAVAARRSGVAFLHAADAGAEGARKIAAAILRGYGNEAAGVPRVTLSSAQLDLALGRPNVIHAALLAGRASETFVARWRTLERYRMSDPGDRGYGARQPQQKAPGLASE